MTMPHLSNCSHRDEGWCPACVKALGEENIRLMATRPMTRCKFHCWSIGKRKSTRWNQDAQRMEDCFVYDAEMQAVSSGSEENKQFFASTPGGTFKVTAIREDHFEPGQSYYFDISQAETP